MSIREYKVIQPLIFADVEQCGNEPSSGSPELTEACVSGYGPLITGAITVQSPGGLASPRNEQVRELVLSSSGLESVDGLLGGGMPLGKLGVVCAAQGCGKTTYGLQIARKNAERGLHARFATFSMLVNECVQWYGTAIRHEPAVSRSELSIARFGIWNCRDINREIDCVLKIERQLQNDRAHGKDVRVIVVDSLEAMAHRQPGERVRGLGAYFQRLGDLALSLSEMAARNGVGIWLTVQANEFSKSPAPKIKRATVGCRKIRDSAFVWLNLDSTRVKCHKNDGGPTFSRQVLADFPARRFVDVESPNSTTSLE